jgi:ABC-2 type transport system permease protein
MNIYVFEMKAQLKSFIIWAVSILAVYLLFMSGLFGVLQDSRDGVEKALAGFPPAFAAAFGINIEKFFTFGGFYGFIFSYIALFGAIMAVSMSVSVFSREKRAKCVDFLLTKPRSRENIFFSKLLATLTLLFVTNILFVLVSMVTYSSSGSEGTDPGRLIWASCALFFTQLVFISIGMVFAVFAKKVRSVSGAATAFGFGGFILSALHGLLEKDEIRFVAPLKYFDTTAVFETGGYEVKYALAAAVVIVVCAGFAYVRFIKSDTPSL